jgi:hypothetical protein
MADFKITISAVDKATATVRKVNESIGKFTAPFIKVKNASAMLGKELGIDRMAKSLGGVAKAAQDVGEKMSRVVAPLAAIVGVGSVAAIAELAKKWGELGSEIGRTSITLGVSTGNLQALRGAAELSGVSAESLTGGLHSLGTTLEDATYGRNQDALVFMNMLGITMKHTADGAVDTVSAFSDVADAIARYQNQPQKQELIARAFGLEAALPLLRKGRAGIDQYNEAVRKSGAIMGGPALAAASAFRESMVFMNIGIDGLKNSIGAGLVPVLQPLVEKLTKWITANRELIATKFAEVARDIANAVSSIDFNAVVSCVESFCSGVKSAVDFVGGWKNAIIGLVILMNGSLIASIVNLGLAMGRVAWVGIPIFVRGIGLLAVGSSALMLKMALLTETALPALSSAFLAVGAAIEATPVGWIITAIAAVSVAGYELVKHWDDIKHWWRRLWGDMSDDASNGSNRINAAARNGSSSSLAGNAPAAGSTLLPGEAEANSRFDQRLKERLTLKMGRGGWMKDAFVLPDGVTNSAKAADAKARAEYAKASEPERKQIRAVTGLKFDDAATPGDPASTGLLALIRKLENSGDNAVSTAGAIGRYQIMPNTARQYGFDPAKLTDPKYNETAAQAVLRDLQKKYGNDTDAILTGYNAGPGRANQFLAAGRNPAVLPLETQKYLAHSHQLLAQSGPAVATPYSAVPTQIDQEAAKMGITTSLPGAQSQSDNRVQASAQSTAGTVRVEVVLSNAPPGTKVRTQTKGPLIVDTKIGYAMPEYI